MELVIGDSNGLNTLSLFWVALLSMLFIIIRRRKNEYSEEKTFTCFMYGNPG